MRVPLLILRGTFNTGLTLYLYGVLYAQRHYGNDKDASGYFYLPFIMLPFLCLRYEIYFHGCCDINYIYLCNLCRNCLRN